MANMFSTSGTGLSVNGELISRINGNAGWINNNNLPTCRLWRALFFPSLMKGMDDEAINYCANLPRIDVNTSKLTKEVTSWKTAKKTTGEDDSATTEMLPVYFKAKLDEAGNVDYNTTASTETVEVTEDSDFTFDAVIVLEKKVALTEDADLESGEEGVDFKIEKIEVENKPVILENPMVPGCEYTFELIQPTASDEEGEGSNEPVGFYVPGTENGDEDGETPAPAPEVVDLETVNELVRRFGKVPYEVKINTTNPITAINEGLNAAHEIQSNYWLLGYEDLAKGVEDGLTKEEAEACKGTYVKAGEDAIVGMSLKLTNRDKSVYCALNLGGESVPEFTTTVNTDLTTHIILEFEILYVERPYDGAPLQYRTDIYTETIRMDWKNK